eukprot:Em0017g673a
MKMRRTVLIVFVALLGIVWAAQISKKSNSNSDISTSLSGSRSSSSRSSSNSDSVDSKPLFYRDASYQKFYGRPLRNQNTEAKKPKSAKNKSDEN